MAASSLRAGWASGIVLALLFITAPAYGQQNRGQQRPPTPAELYAKLKAAKFSGAVKQVKDNTITVIVTGNKEVTVQPSPLAPVAVDVTGTAEFGALTTGMTVEFTGKVNKKGDFEGPVESLTVHEASDNSVKLGFYPPDGDESGPTVRLKDEASEQFIRAKIRTLKDDELTVTAPGASPIKFKLAPEAKINLAFRSLNVAHMGDGITIEGKEVQVGQYYGEKITIKLTNPLQGKKKPGAPTKPSDSPFGFSQ